MLEFQAILKKSGDKLVVVHFTAPWSDPCKRIAPVYKELSENIENQNVVFLSLDIDEAHTVAHHCKVGPIPTFQFFKDELKVAEFTGANETNLKQKVKELSAKVTKPGEP